MDKWLYEIPANTLGWYVRLRALASGDPPTLKVQSKSGLSEQTGLARIRVKPIMTELKAKGIITTSKVAGPGWIIHFTKDPFTLEGEGVTEKATTKDWEFGRVADIFAAKAKKVDATPTVIRANFDEDPRKNIRRLLSGAYDNVATVERRADIVGAVYALDNKIRYGAKVGQAIVTGPQMDAAVKYLAKHRASDLAFACWVWQDMVKEDYWKSFDSTIENRFKFPLDPKRAHLIETRRREYYDMLLGTMSPAARDSFNAMLQARGY